MLTTSEFARLCATTKKTIIHYDRIGLLQPVTKKGTFRFYQPTQVLDFQKIYLLKSFGLTLKQIKDYRSKKDLLDLFIKTKSDLEVKKIFLENKINKINEFIKNLKNNKPMIDPKIRMIKPYSIYAIRTIGRYVDIDEYQKQIYKKINDLQYQQPGLTIFLDPIYSPHKANMICGVIIKKQNNLNLPSDVEIIKMTNYKALCYTHIGSYRYLSYIWQFLKKYKQMNNLKSDPKRHSLEIYYRGDFVEKNEDNFITELQIPII